MGSDANIAIGIEKGDFGHLDQRDAHYDVVVYGASPSGICAAIAAKREGANVVLVEPRPWLGGMITAGIATQDVTLTAARAQVVGLANEYFTRLTKEYATTQQAFFLQAYNAEPHVHLKVFRAWLREERVPVYLNNKLTSLDKSGTTITDVTFDGIGRIFASNFIDATYEGDLLAMAGCSYIVGREASTQYSEADAGTVLSVGHQFSQNVDPYVTAGQPASGTLPWITGAAPSAGQASGLVMAMNYRLAVTTNTSAMTAFPAPSTYNALNYELLGRYAAAGGIAQLSDVVNPIAQQGTNKYSWNNNGPVSTDYFGPEATEYVTASWARRAQIDLIIKDYTLGFIQFLQTDSRIPSAVKTSLANYGFCSDEWQAYGSFPPMPYVREGRRLIGDFVLPEGGVTAANGYSDQVAYVQYTADCHNCQRVISGGYAKNEGNIQVSVNLGSKIPLRVIMPKVAECTNLVVTGVPSASHVAFGAIRMESTLMALGQAAGIVSAIAAQQAINAQAVGSTVVQTKMDINRTNAFGGSILTSDGSVGSGAVISGTWSTSSATFGFVGGGVYHAGSATGATIKLPLNIKKAGPHDVYAKWPESTANARSTAVPVTVSSNEGTTSMTVDQNLTGDGGDWLYLGRFTFSKGTAGYVQFGTDGAGNSTVVNAVKALPVQQ